jgi:hypothetical protein
MIEKNVATKYRQDSIIRASAIYTAVGKLV